MNETVMNNNTSLNSMERNENFDETEYDEMLESFYFMPYNET